MSKLEAFDRSCSEDLECLILEKVEAEVKRDLQKVSGGGIKVKS